MKALHRYIPATLRYIHVAGSATHSPPLRGGGECSAPPSATSAVAGSSSRKVGTGGSGSGNPMLFAGGDRPQATPLYPGAGCPTGASATTGQGAIGARAQRALRLIGAPEVPDGSSGAALEGRSGRPRLSLVPPRPERGWYAEEDEAGELRGMSPLGHRGPLTDMVEITTVIASIRTRIGTHDVPADLTSHGERALLVSPGIGRHVQLCPDSGLGVVQ